MEAMKESERTRTINGSLNETEAIVRTSENREM